MSPDTVASASPVFDPLASAAVLTQARLGQLPRPLDLPAALRPQDAAQAYAVQDAVVQARGRVVGWKVGAANPQALPARAALTQDTVWVCTEGQVQDLPVAGNAVIGVEAELAYELACDLPPREQPYSEADVLAAVRAAHAAIEVCDTRYAAWGVQGEWSRLADQACHGALVVGSGRLGQPGGRPAAPADLAGQRGRTQPGRPARGPVGHHRFLHRHRAGGARCPGDGQAGWHWLRRTAVRLRWATALAMGTFWFEVNLASGA